MIVGEVMPLSSVKAEKPGRYSAPQLGEERVATECGNSFKNHLSYCPLLTGFKYSCTKASAILHI
jgi:hypothetical protein